MEEEVTNTESIKDAIEAGNKEIEDVKIQYADEIDELIKKTLTEKDIENFTIPELSDEKLKEVEATEDDIKVYKIARELEYDKEDKLDVENYIDKDFLSNIVSKFNIPPLAIFSLGVCVDFTVLEFTKSVYMVGVTK